MSNGRVDRRTLERRLIEGGALVAGLSALLLVPVSLGGFTLPWPIALIWAAYGWSGAGPTVRASVVIFALGLWLDALTGGPLGAWVLVGLAAYATALLQRTFVAFEGQAGSFAGCALAAIGAAVVGTILVFSNGDGTLPLFFLAQLAFTVILFPLVAGTFTIDDDEGVS